MTQRFGVWIIEITLTFHHCGNETRFRNTYERDVVKLVLICWLENFFLCCSVYILFLVFAMCTDTVKDKQSTLVLSVSQPLAPVYNRGIVVAIPAVVLETSISKRSMFALLLFTHRCLASAIRCPAFKGWADLGPWHANDSCLAHGTLKLYHLHQQLSHRGSSIFNKKKTLAYVFKGWGLVFIQICPLFHFSIAFWSFIHL